jgi:hypothetical protein
VLTERIPRFISADARIGLDTTMFGHVQRLPLNHMPIKPCKLSLLAVDRWGDPVFKWEEGVKNVLPDFSSVTTES